MWQYTLVITAILAVIAITFYLLKKIDKDIKFIDSLIKRRYLVAFIYFVTFIALGIHGFSVDKWSDFINLSGITTKLWGFNRSIQSDVWAIGIPQLLNQIQNGMPLFNTTIMTQGANMVLSGLPALDLTLIGQPHYWGCLFGSYIGLSWLYWFKIFALLLSTYEVMHFLLKDRKRMAMLGALLITFSPLMSWWLGHTVSTVVIYMHMCIAAIIVYTRNINEIKIKIFSSIVGGISLAGFVLAWYPALQVPFGFLAIILLVAVIYRFIKSGRKFSKIDIPIIGVPIAFSVFMIVRFIIISADSISQLMNTSFPGKRFINGGGYDLQTLFYYLFEPLFAGKHPTFMNECEASSILPFIPGVFVVAVIIIIWSIKNKKKNRVEGLFLALFIYEIFLVLWLFINFPNWFARISLFSNVTESRVVWTIAIISVYLGMMSLVYIWEKIKIKKIICGFLSLFVSVVLYIIIKNKMDVDFLNYYGIPAKVVIFTVFLLFTAFNFAYFSGMKKTVITCLIILSFGTFISVNPVQRGTSALEKSELAEEIQTIISKDEDSYWAADGFFVYGNFISAQGAKVFNTTNQYMDEEKWCIIDPNGNYVDVYNRYAQVSLEISENKDTVLVLENPDLILVKLSVSDIKNLGINYMISTKNLSIYSNNEIEFSEIYKDKNSNLCIFEIKY